MSRLRSLTNYIADVREVADIEGMTGRHPDALLCKYINRAVAELVDAIAESGQDYNTTKSSFSTVSGTSDYTSTSAMPTDHYKTRGIDLFITSTQPINVSRYNFEERNRLRANGNWSPGDGIAYRIIGATLRILPPPGGVYVVDHHYYITAPRFDTAAGSATFDCINGSGEKYIVYAAAAEVGGRDDDERTEKRRGEAALLKAAFIESISNRDVTEAERVREVVGRDRSYRGRHYRGRL